MFPRDTLFAFALEREARPFRRCFPRAIVTVTGVGRDCASDRLRAVLNQQHAELVVIAGFAGGLVGELKLGDILVPKQVIDVCNGAVFNAHPVFNQIDSEIKLFTQSLCTCDRIIGDPQEKRTLGIQHDAIAVDMESAALAAVCDQAGIPWLVIRVISDDVDQELSPELIKFLSRGKPNAVRALRAALASPKLLPEFIRLARDTRLASEKLAQFLEACVYSP